MDLTVHLTQVLRDVVLHPNYSTAVILFVSSIINELASVLPYVIVLSGQIIFVQEPLSLALFFKLLLYTAIPVGVGATIGTSAYYVAAYYGGKPLINKFGKYVRLSWKSVDKFSSKFKGSHYDDLFFFSLRMIPFLPGIPISAAAGIVRMSPVRFVFFTIAGFVIRIMILFAFIGFGAEVLAH